jgi:N-acetylneuraminic acid mutarotase
MVYEYDPATDKWTKKKTMPLLSHHVAFAEYRGKIYAFGGFVYPASGPAAWVPVDNAWEYDPAADSWKALAAMPTKRGSPVAATVGDKIYVIGGAALPPGSKETAVLPGRPHISVGAVEEYDPGTNTWRARASMPTPRNHATAGAINGKIYVIGGRVGTSFISSGSSNIDVVEEYDPAVDAWGAARARMPSARSAMASGVYEGRIYVTGGEGQDAQRMYTFRALEAYDPATNSWAVLPSMPVSRHGLAGGVVGNRLHMVSGDVQSAGTGVQVHTDSHDAFEFAK